MNVSDQYRCGECGSPDLPANAHSRIVRCTAAPGSHSAPRVRGTFSAKLTARSLREAAGDAQPLPWTSTSTRSHLSQPRDVMKIASDESRPGSLLAQYWPATAKGRQYERS
jgi:hypothetical protein